MEDKDFLFSVIIPVYKVEKYLSECVESVLSQELANIEIILIDDGSPDNSPVICDNYAKLYRNIRVIHKINGGLSSARNAGIDASKGEYIIFLDSDDTIANGALKQIERELSSHPDVLITELFNTENMNIEYAPNTLYCRPNSNSKEDVYKFVFFDKPNTWPSVQYIIRRELIIHNDIRFDIGYLHEDVSWTARIFAYSRSFEYFDKVWYVRRIGRSDSITSSVNAKRTLDMISLVAKQIKTNTIYDCLSQLEKRTCFAQLVRAVFSSLYHYLEYTPEEQDSIDRALKQNWEITMWAKSFRHKAFFMLAKIIGLKQTIRLWKTINV